MSDAHALRERATRAVGWVVLERWGSRLMSLGVLLVLTRQISPDDFGLVTLATSVIVVFQVFADSGVSSVLIQQKSLTHEDESTAFWAALGGALVICLGVVAAAPLLAALVGEPGVTPVLRLLSLYIPLQALSQTPAALLERRLLFRSLSLRQLVGTLAGTVVAVPLAYLGFGAYALVLQFLTTTAVSVVALWVATPWRPSFTFSMASLKRMRSLGLAILATDLLEAFQGNIDKFVIGIFFSPAQLAYYYIAQRLGTVLMDLVTTVIARVSFSTFARVQDDRRRLNRVFRQFTFASTTVAVPVFGLTALFATQLIPFIFGKAWVASVPIVWILAPGLVVASMTYFDRMILLATGQARTALTLSLLQNGTGVALIFALLPLGVPGVAVSRLARVVIWPIRITVLRRAVSLEVRPYLRQFASPVLAFAPAAVVVTLLQLSSWASSANAVLVFVLPLSALAVLSYAAGMWALADTEGRNLIRLATVQVRARLPHRLSSRAAR